MNYRVEEDFEYKGFRCVVVASVMGHRCGYVQIPKGHPYFAKSYDEITDIDDNLSVHGGLTYGSSDSNYPVPTEGKVYWIGFDCRHGGDAEDMDILRELNPRLYNFYKKHRSEGHVWTVDEVSDEIRRLVNQIVYRKAFKNNFVSWINRIVKAVKGW